MGGASGPPRVAGVLVLSALACFADAFRPALSHPPLGPAHVTRASRSLQQLMMLQPARGIGCVSASPKRFPPAFISRPRAQVSRAPAPAMLGNRGGFDLSQLALPLLFVLLLASGALPYVLSAVNVVLLLVLAAGLLLPPAIQWWLSSNLVEGTCPDCGAPQQVFKGQGQYQCMNCGASMTSELSDSGVLIRAGMVADDGLVDVSATTEKRDS